MSYEHRPTKANELPLIDAPETAELIGVLDGVTGRVPTAKIVEIVKEGASAYEVAVSQGFEGTKQEWLDSLIGDLTEQARVEREAAEAARDVSQTARIGAEDARDEIEAVLANVDGYDATLGLLSPAARRVVQAADVVAVRIYDTTTDTDGGAWRYEVPGGAPSKILAVARPASVTLYTLDDPACPAWKTITRSDSSKPNNEFWRNGRNPTCLAAGEGIICFGIATPAPGTGLCVLDLAARRVARFSSATDGGWGPPGSLDRVNSDGATILPGSGGPVLGNSAVFGVSLTVLSGTRLDPSRCGLPMPTIALATTAGLSIVLPDGRVTHSAATGAVSAVAFLGNGDLVWQMPGTWGTQYTRRDQVQTTGFAQIGIGQIGDVVAFQGLATMGRQRFAGWREGVDGQLNLVDLTAFRQSSGSELGAQITDTFTSGYHFAAVNGGARKTPLVLADSTADLSDLVDGTAADRSGAGNHPVITGAFTREPVAAGAQLAALRGVDHAGMVVADIPWDTLKERAIILWSYPIDQNGSHVIAGWGLTAFNESAPPARWGLITGWTNVDVAGTVRFAERANNMLSRPIWPQRWYQVILGIRDLGGGSFRRELWVNGELHNSGAQGNPAMDPELPLRLFQGSGGGDAPAWPTALLRYCDAMPSPAEIRSMYAAERPLFEPGAQCLLPSRDVRAVAHDESRGETLVGTAAGSAGFRGLRRIRTIDAASVEDAALMSSDTHSAVAAADGIRVIGTAAEVYATLPAIPLREAALERRPVLVYDPNEVEASGTTADATPRDLLKLAIAEGFAAGFEAVVATAEHGNVDGERACYRITGHVARDQLGNVVVQASTTMVFETTSTMDATAAADTTAQTLDITATGKATTTLGWTVRLQLTEAGHAA